MSKLDDHNANRAKNLYASRAAHGECVECGAKLEAVRVVADESLEWYCCSQGCQMNWKGETVTDEDYPPRLLEAVEQLESPTALDVQVGGSHYKDFAIQPVEFCQINGLNYCESNIIKYVCRHKAKAGRQDLEKVIHYAQMLLEMEYGVSRPGA